MKQKATIGNTRRQKMALFTRRVFSAIAPIAHLEKELCLLNRMGRPKRLPGTRRRPKGGATRKRTKIPKAKFSRKLLANPGSAICHPKLGNASGGKCLPQTVLRKVAESAGVGGAGDERPKLQRQLQCADGDDLCLVEKSNLPERTKHQIEKQ